ncbi:MAG: iron ABC transporter permease [Candidatus Limiplasma sp.]|nr:iron ABC transporter permease [Candidatus Limiplasma sp.]
MVAAQKQSRRLDRKKLFGDPILVSTIVALLIFLLLFILYPLATLLVDSVFNKESGFTLDVFSRVLSLSRFRTAFTNTLVLGLITGFASTLIGLLFAYVDVYMRVRSRVVKKLFDVVSMLPVVSPPFVLSLSMILLFGRSGLITRTLLGIYDSNIYGLQGIAIVQTLTFFPVCYLMLKGLLRNIDPSLEEAARDMGATRWKVFTTITLPLLLPGLGNAFLVTFIEAVADFANPMLIGGSYDTLATTIYLQVTGAYDKVGAAAMAVVLLALTLVLFLIQKYYLEKRTVATLTGKASRERMLIADKSVTRPLTLLCSLFSAFVVLMYVSVLFGALFKLWGRNYSLSWVHFEYILKYGGARAFRDSFLLSIIAAPITALLSMIISYLVVKKKFRSKALIEFTSMLAMAVPGTVLGVGYIRGFANGVFGTGFLQSLYGTGAILVIVFVVRSLPVGTRSGISALRQIDRSIEESAYDMGANSGKVFMTVTLPLIKDSFFSGLVTTFVRSITAISAIILLVTPKYLLITTQINEFAEKGKFGEACAYATVLILIVYCSILLMNLFIKTFGTSKNIREARKNG